MPYYKMKYVCFPYVQVGENGEAVECQTILLVCVVRTFNIRFFHFKYLNAQFSIVNYRNDALCFRPLELNHVA